MGDDRSIIEALRDGDTCYVNWFQESGGEVTRHGDTIELHEIGCCGKDIFIGTYPFTDDGISELLAITDSWT